MSVGCALSHTEPKARRIAALAQCPTEPSDATNCPAPKGVVW